MNKTTYAPNAVPTANIAVNKSRLKIYKNAGDLPTYYLNKGQEFQIELFNPTSDCVLAKIKMNGKTISQGGLVLKPGQRVYLDRYLDVPKKFLFDTYEVSNTSEVKKAIEDNGDITIEFFKEQTPPPIYWNNNLFLINNAYRGYDNTGGYPYTYQPSTITVNGAIGGGVRMGSVNAFYNTNNNTLNAVSSISSANSTMTYTDSLGSDLSTQEEKRPIRKFKKISIETGRVEEGSYSDQTFSEVNKNFEYWAFHTIEYKLLPISQKVNTVADINVKRYCTNCGAKSGKTDKFCSNCGTKI